MPDFARCRDCDSVFNRVPEPGLAPPVRCRPCRALRRRSRVFLNGRVVAAGPRFSILEAGGEKFYYPAPLPAFLSVGGTCSFWAIEGEKVKIGGRLRTAFHPGLGRFPRFFAAVL